MDRPIIFVGENPLDTDFLTLSKSAYLGLSMLAQAILGTSTQVDGLNCTPTSPASMQVKVAQGSIMSVGNVDDTAYGTIGSDTAHQVFKQGIVLGDTLFTITAPSTTGQSQRFLIQAKQQDQDTGSTVLPYYNASNPSSAWAGPNNTGVAQNTLRKSACVLNLKVGTAATTGTQTTPAPDAGFTGLWVIDLANGATTVTSGNITRYPGAPFIDEKLKDKGTGTSTRTFASGNVDLYVATSGSDSNPGTSGSPFQTIQHAVDVLLKSYDGNGFSATIHVAAGTYTAGVVVNRPFIGFSSVQIAGSATTAPANCVISTTSADCIQVVNSAVLNVSGFKVTTTTGGNGLNASQQGYIVVNGFMEYGAVASGNSQIAATFGGEVDPNANYTISGGGPSHWSAQGQGRVNISSGGITVTITGGPTFGSAFADLSDQAYIRAASATFSGSITGQQFSVKGNSVLSTAGTSGSFPGSGTTVNTGGQVI